MDYSPDNATPRATALFGIAAFCGIAFALFDVIDSASEKDQWPDSSIVARVDGVGIPMRRYDELLADLAADSREPLDRDDREYALERLIHEELLIQRARELGLDARVPAVRKALARAVISQVVAEAAAQNPTKEDLRSLYASGDTFFTQPAMYGVRWYRISGLSNADFDIVAAARQELVNGSDVSLARQHAPIELALELPRDPVPASTLSNYLGETLTAAIVAMRQGEYSSPIYAQDRWHILNLREKLPTTADSFEKLKPALVAEFQRRNADKALREHLSWLADRATIDVNPAIR